MLCGITITRVGIARVGNGVAFVALYSAWFWGWFRGWFWGCFSWLWCRFWSGFWCRFCCWLWRGFWCRWQSSKLHVATIRVAEADIHLSYPSADAVFPARFAIALRFWLSVWMLDLAVVEATPREARLRFGPIHCQLLHKTVNRTSSIDQFIRAVRQVTKVLISIAGIWIWVSRVWNAVAF